METEIDLFFSSGVFGGILLFRGTSAMWRKVGVFF